jgi:hypothetical protein
MLAESMPQRGMMSDSWPKNPWGNTLFFSTEPRLKQTISFSTEQILNTSLFD